MAPLPDSAPHVLPAYAGMILPFRLASEGQAVLPAYAGMIPGIP